MKHLKRDEMVVIATCQQTKNPFGITVEKLERSLNLNGRSRLTPAQSKEKVSTATR